MKKLLATTLILLSISFNSEALEFHCHYPDNVNLGDWSTHFHLYDVESWEKAHVKCSRTQGTFSYNYEFTDLFPDW